MKIIRLAAVCVILGAVFFSWGCQLPAIMSKETRYEKKVPAEYNLKAQSDKKLLVLINQPSWLGGASDLNENLTKAVYANLISSKILKSTALIPYEQIKAFSEKDPDYFYAYPKNAGESLNADLVLFIVIDQKHLEPAQQGIYYKGLLSGRSQLIEVSGGDILWPVSPDGKIVRVEFDVEKGGYDAAGLRLANSFAHCVVRYFYDCPVAKFQTFDDKSQSGWRQWEE